MANTYIGSRISLISKSDIRYVGLLHNINSQDSTVALEQGEFWKHGCMEMGMTCGMVNASGGG